MFLSGILLVPNMIWYICVCHWNLSENISSSSRNKDKRTQHVHQLRYGNENSFNVALTRAKTLLILIGYDKKLQVNNLWY